MTSLNEIKVSELSWGGRAAAALKNGGFLDGQKTLADLDAMKDEDLLNIHRLGKISLNEIREKTVQAKARNRETRMATTINTEEIEDNGIPVSAQKQREKVNDPVMDFAEKHRSVIEALMKGEVKIDLNS